MKTNKLLLMILLLVNYILFIVNLLLLLSSLLSLLNLSIINVIINTATARCLYSVPPTIIRVPGDQEVTVNGRIELECVAEGLPTPVISWRVNNTEHQSTIS